MESPRLGGKLRGDPSNFAPARGTIDSMPGEELADRFFGPEGEPDSDAPLPPITAEEPPVDAQEFEAATGESLERTLDLDTWEPGEDLAALYARIEREVDDAVKQESRTRERIREEVFPRLRSRSAAPPGAGV